MNYVDQAPYLIGLILAVSILLQVASAIQALLLVRLTGLRYSWIFIAVALLLMTVRRIVPLCSLVSGNGCAVGLSNEIIGLALSFFMLLGVRGIRAVFVERIAAEDKVRSLLAEKQLVLREVHHRIRNNMGVLSSLLSIQARKVRDPAALAALDEAQGKIHNMGLLYDKLYRSTDFSELSVKDYLETLVDDVIGNFPDCAHVQVHKDVHDFMLDAKRLQSLGIIINELLTNIMKYAFQGRDGGAISVQALKDGNHVSVIIADDGIGLPESVSLANSTGFGLQLIAGLVQQLNGTMRIERLNGTKFALDFEL